MIVIGVFRHTCPHPWARQQTHPNSIPSLLWYRYHHGQINPPTERTCMMPHRTKRKSTAGRTSPPQNLLPPKHDATHTQKIKISSPCEDGRQYHSTMNPWSLSSADVQSVPSCAASYGRHCWSRDLHRVHGWFHWGWRHRKIVFVFIR